VRGSKIISGRDKTGALAKRSSRPDIGSVAIQTSTILDRNAEAERLTLKTTLEATRASSTLDQIKERTGSANLIPSAVGIDNRELRSSDETKSLRIDPNTLDQSRKLLVVRPILHGIPVAVAQEPGTSV